MGIWYGVQRERLEGFEMNRTFLDSLNLPDDLKELTYHQQHKLAAEVRDLIVDVVSTNGGHLAPSLGVVELTIALLSVMEMPKDKIIWDVGHQCYAYKVLTDRRDRFSTLRQAGGLSGFPRPQESPYDCFCTGHASTAISAALGMARARDLIGEKHCVTAVVGDGALGGGMAWEALNDAGDADTPLLVILNDNRMSISPSIGALATHIARLRTQPLYISMEDSAQFVFRTIPMGGLVKKITEGFKRGVTNLVSPTSGTIFEALGFKYYGPINGHDIGDLKHFISLSRNMKGPVLLHVVTTKGKGYSKAEHKPRYFHGVPPFNSGNGKTSGKKTKTYTDVFGGALVALASRDSNIVAITAAMTDGTGLAKFARRYPTRFFNVGIAEGHAVTFAAGLASAGAKPVVAIYSTFLQRAYDQIVQDVCLQNLPVIFAIDRAGIVGEDGPTHHGAFDLSYLGHIPNLIVMAPKDAPELVNMLKTAFDLACPVAIRYPRGAVGRSARANQNDIPVGRAEILRHGDDIAVIGVGPIVHEACCAADELANKGIQLRVVNARFVKPLDEKTILSATRECCGLVIAEENVARGGFGSAVIECLSKHGASSIPIERVTLPDSFVGFGSTAELRAIHRLTKDGIMLAVDRLLQRTESYQTKRGESFVIRTSI